MEWNGVEWHGMGWHGLAWNEMVLDDMGYIIKQHCSSAEVVYEQHMDMDITWVFQKQIVNARRCEHVAAFAIRLLVNHPHGSE